MSSPLLNFIPNRILIMYLLPSFLLLAIVWISPVSKNYDGERTPYGDAYHGYWISDASQLNDKFGTSDDLKALSDELHSRGM